jgi:hypothetical protein
VREALAETGARLAAATREEMEARFGYDFSTVRVHDGAGAAAAADRLHADAFAVGDDLVFARGRYAPATHRGRELLAHELAHTVQQRGATREAPALDEGSTLEAEARGAGRAAANGVPAGPLAASALAVARAPANPEYFDDNELAEQVAKYTEKLKQASYPGRSGDADWLERLKATLKQRTARRESEAAAAKRPRKAASHHRTAGQERRASVLEAESAIADLEVAQVRSAAEEKEEEEELEPTSMRLDEPGQKKAGPPPKAKPKPKPKPKRPVAPKTPAKFTPGGFTDEDIYGETKAQSARIDAENAHARDPRRFEVRLAEARSKAPATTNPSDFPNSVWEYGLSAGLFAERERGLVTGTVAAPMNERMNREARHNQMLAQYAQQQQFEQFHQQLDLMFIQGALMGRAPLPIQAGYAAYSGAETGKAIGTAIRTGDPVDIGNAVVPLAGGLAFGAVVHGGGGPPPEEPAGAPRVELEEVTPDQVRQLYRAEPDAVKKNLSGSFHQLVWERLGGQGQAPPFFRAGRVMQVFERAWTGDLSEINQPHELGAGGSLPPDPFATSDTLADPVASTDPGAPPQEPAPADPGGGTIQSAVPVPRARPGAGGPRRAPAAPRAFEVSVADVADAYRANPGSVFASRTSAWHDQIWILDGGREETPALFRSGRTYIIDLERLTDAERAEIGIQ